MNWDALGKYAVGAATLGSVFALVVLGKVDAQVYIGLVGGVLTGIGYHAGVNTFRRAAALEKMP